MSSNQLTIGDVFTPINWGEFAVEKFGIFDLWLSGKTIFDPTMGIGNLLISLVKYGLKKGYSIEELPIKNLFGNEINKDYYLVAIKSFNGLSTGFIKDNFSNNDLLTLEKKQYDVIFTNPPWLNFQDLPFEYKQFSKPYFSIYGLIENNKDLLLGGSRIDFSALIMQICISDFLKPNGTAIAFLPLSLFLNDGPHQFFRKYSNNELFFSLEEIYDFKGVSVFENVSTRYCVAKFEKSKKTKYPIVYNQYIGNKWVTNYAKPLFNNTDPLEVSTLKFSKNTNKRNLITIQKSEQPRQGINTCGANHIYFISSNDLTERDDTIIIENRFHISKEFIFPLVTVDNFKNNNLTEPKKWVVLPYSSDGKVLSLEKLTAQEGLFSYLNQYKEALSTRKGTLIQSQISKGFWWALLGVGPYSFAKWKVIWEAYGKKEFRSIIVPSKWQANQSLQAFFPCNTIEIANRLNAEINEPWVLNYLLSTQMEGSMNWAQPGKIKKILNILDTKDSLTLF